MSAAEHEAVLGALNKLIWAVHFGKSFDASSKALEAQILLDKLAA